ncbi:MAG: squalene--hopene cyclase, partial [Thermoanaerobaculia bacterium]|nr:squalene--hopene cyclase [Thermoanaerobaculia bacterium]
ARRWGRAPAAQTAWALLGLFALGEWSSSAVTRGLEHLLRTQRGDGTWCDEHWTGTGFPKVFYLRYHLYATYFPLLALARFEERLRGAGEPTA